MVSSRSGDGPAPDAAKMVTSGRSGRRKDLARYRLADALRANLRRRKAQQREQKRQQAAQMPKATTAETGSPETLSSQALLPRD